MSTASDLLADAWVGSRRGEIDLAHARQPAPGHPQRGGTAYLCAADGDGLLVSLIQSNFLAFGCGIHVPEWGINLNNRGSSFALDPSPRERVRPGKLPMHTLIPAMVLRDGRPELVFGSMGGDAQAQVHAQVLTGIVDDGRNPQAAIDVPRWRVGALGLAGALRGGRRSGGARGSRGAGPPDDRRSGPGHRDGSRGRDRGPIHRLRGREPTLGPRAPRSACSLEGVSGAARKEDGRGGHDGPTGHAIEKLQERE